ncbi:MAG TPA: hypothetical protein VJQ44_01390 [Gemmatimonadales bacterium]|nr:hypothetical protein [Gemmatimonadales bacterium]
MRLPRLALMVALAGCRPETTRPAIVPVPAAASTEIRLVPQEATNRLAEAMVADSIPLARVRARDGYIESRWIDSATGHATRRMPLGTGVVRVRAWADPGRPGNTVLTVETVYRPLADPSLPERELDRQVPKTHPVAVKVEAELAGMLKRWGGPPPPESAKEPAPTAPQEGEEQ